MSKTKDKSNDVFAKTWNPNSELWITPLEALMEGFAIKRGFERTGVMKYLGKGED